MTRPMFPRAFLSNNVVLVAVLVLTTPLLAGDGPCPCADVLPECDADVVPFKGVEAGVQFVQNFEFPILTVGFESRGTGTQIGAYEAVGSFEINVDTEEAGNAHGLLTAANGDEIFVDLVGVLIDDFTTCIYGEITGGTGRFEGAEGCYHYLLVTEFPRSVLPNSFVGVWDGTISTLGSQ